MSDLNNKLIEIKNEKDTKLIPSNIKKGVTILGVTGTYGSVEKPYIELEYIESTGTQYIDTNKKPTNNYEIDATLSFNDLSSPSLSYAYFITNEGSNYGYNSSFSVRLASSSGDRIEAGFNGSSSTSVSLTEPLQSNVAFNVKLGSTGIAINNDNSAFSNTSSFTSNNNLVIGAEYRMSDYSGIPMRLYAIKLYYNTISDGKFGLLNLIPVKRKSDNKICMYDKISGNFVLNAGTGEFIAGPVKDLSPKIEDDDFDIGEDGVITGDTVELEGTVNGDTFEI